MHLYVLNEAGGEIRLYRKMIKFVRRIMIFVHHNSDDPQINFQAH